MKYCVRCGRPLHISATQCDNCGLRQPYVPPELLDKRYPPPAGMQNGVPIQNGMPMQNTAPPQYNAPAPYGVPTQYRPIGPAVACTAMVPVYYRPLPRHKKGVIPFLIWSILLIPFFNPIGTPLGIISAFLCLRADADEGENSERSLSAAAVLCIIATVLDVITLIVLVFMAAAVLQIGSSQ